MHTRERSPAASDQSHLVEAETKYLADELRRTIRGEVRFDDGSRALYATDSSNYRQVTIRGVIPRDVEDGVSTIAACYRFGAPIPARGGWAGPAGHLPHVPGRPLFPANMNNNPA